MTDRWTGGWNDGGGRKERRDGWIVGRGECMGGRRTEDGQGVREGSREGVNILYLAHLFHAHSKPFYSEI